MSEPFYQIQLRRGTADEWASANPILASGEPGFEIDTGLFKLGDGVSTWLLLPYTVHAPSDATPLEDGTATPGNGLQWARGDHVHPAGSGYLPITGGTLSGDLTLNDVDTPAVLNVRSDVDYSEVQIAAIGSKTSAVVFQKLIGGLTKNRWKFGADADPANFILRRYDDAGVFIDDPFWVDRATGEVRVKYAPISSTGVLRKEDFPIVRGSYYVASDQSVATATTVTMPLTANGTIEGGLTLSSNKIIIPVDGIYAISASASFAAGGASAGQRNVYIMKAGTAIARTIMAGSAIQQQPSCTAVQRLVVGDQIGLSVHQTSGGNMTIMGTAPINSNIELALVAF